MKKAFAILMMTALILITIPLASFAQGEAVKQSRWEKAMKLQGFFQLP
jgi:hypothetical protein